MKAGNVRALKGVFICTLGEEFLYSAKKREVFSNTVDEEALK